MEIDKNLVGTKIKFIRLSRGDNMREFGESLQKHSNGSVGPASDSIVSRWEKGVSLPSPERLKVIADLGNISVEELLYGEPKTYLDNLLSNSNLLNDFSTIVFDKFYEDLESSASSEEDLYLSEEEAAKRYKRFSEQMKLDDHVDDLGSSIHLAYENRSDPNLVQMFLNDAHNEYSLLFGKSPEDANNDIKRKKKE